MLYLILFIALCACASLYFRFRAVPFPVNGGDPRTFRVSPERIKFIYSLSWRENGKEKNEMSIHRHMLNIIREAREFILLDIFLFNTHSRRSDSYPTPQEITDALAQKGIPKLLITDPGNSLYGTIPCEPVDWARKAKVQVCMTDVDKLRDNNLIYSGFWRLFLSWLGIGGKKFIAYPEHKTTLRALLKVANARGNHRKLIITKLEDRYTVLVTSANIYDAGSHFSDIGFIIRDDNVASAFLEAEKAVAEMSGAVFRKSIPSARQKGEALVTPLMGRHIKSYLLKDIKETSEGDRIDIAILFMSDLDVIKALANASERGALVNIVLDGNKRGMAHRKGGFPNNYSSWRIRKMSSSIRMVWNSSRNEFHCKMVFIRRKDKSIVWGGSANLCRRSLSETNLEANVRIEMPTGCQLDEDLGKYFERIAGEPYSLPYQNERPSIFYYWVFLFQEKTGMSTF